ncbi:hypothetical protein C8F04DRAFT_1112327, partial [Mycena alexandri]
RRVFLAPRSPHAYTAACGARPLHRMPKGARDGVAGPVCAGPLHPPSPSSLVLLIHRRPRSSSPPLSPCILRPTRIKRGVVPAVGIECRMCADAQPLVLVHPRLRLSPLAPHPPSRVPRPLVAPYTTPAPPESSGASDSARMPRPTKRSERGLESNVAQLIEVEYTELKT